MSSELLAIFAASFFAASFVTSKRGLSETTLAATLLLTLSSAWIVLVLITFFDRPSSISGDGVLFFVLSGLLSPGIGYSAGLAGVNRLGPSIAVPIQQGGRPLIAVTAAFFLMGETVDWLQMTGILAIIVGGSGLSLLTPEERALSAEDRTVSGRRVSLSHFVRPGVFFPFVAAIGFAGFDVMVKHSLTVMEDPTFGTMVAVGSGLLGWTLVILLTPSFRSSIHFRGRITWVVLAGILFGLAALSIFHALARGRVSIVSPILASQPLIVFLLSRLILRDIESIRVSTVVLGSLVVLGTILVIT